MIDDGKNRSQLINKKYLLVGIFWVFMKINGGILGKSTYQQVFFLI